MVKTHDTAQPTCIQWYLYTRTPVTQDRNNQV